MMPETMRLNQTVSCNGCGKMVNPYVIERKIEINQADTMRLECPTCKYEWRVEEE